MYRANPTYTGAIHVPHDSLRCFLARHRRDDCMLEFGYRTNRPQVRYEFHERVAIMRLVGPDQS